MLQTDGTCTYNSFFKMLSFISHYKLYFIINNFYTFTAHRPLFLFNALQFYLTVIPPPDPLIHSSAHKGAVSPTLRNTTL